MCTGASVAVECEDGSSKPRFRKEVKTNENGEFRVQLPFSVSKHVRRIKGCTVKLISSSEAYCAVASAATSSSIRLKSRKQGLHIFSAGFFSFKPLKQPNLCNQKPTIQNTKKGLGSVKTPIPPNFNPSFPPPLQDPNTPGALVPSLPPLPTLPRLPPMPQLPPLPPLPGIPTPWSHMTNESKGQSNARGSHLMESKEGNMTNESNPTKTSENVQYSDKKLAQPENFILPPNPLLPPPSIPIPFQPPPLVSNPLQPPPLVRNPNPLQPPNPTPLIPSPFQPPQSGPSPFFPLPSVPGLSPSPPLTTPPSLPLPFPPSFPPPIIPGTPPASSTKNASP